MILSKSPYWIDAEFNHYSFGFLKDRMGMVANGFCDFAKPFEYEESYGGVRGIEIEILWGRPMEEEDFFYIEKAK